MLHRLHIVVSPRHPLANDKRQIRRFDAAADREKIGYLRAGLDSIQAWPRLLDAKTLAALCTAGGENRTASLGRHTSTETMALGALAVVRLIGAFHLLSLSCSKSSLESIYQEETLSIRFSSLSGETAYLQHIGGIQERRLRMADATAQANQAFPTFDLHGPERAR